MSFVFLLGPLLVLGAVAAAIAAGFRAMTHRQPKGGEEVAAPVDGAEAAKSAAIHIGLFLAMIASGVGLIDLLQAFVEGDRIAGSNSDIARGLSLLIVGGPAFAALIRVIDRRYTDRAAAGDARPHRGWSVYLVVALTTTLVATLTSVVQVTESLTSESGDYRPEELMQLIGWLALWVVHWFVLRPKFRVRGDVHLALGSIIGLGWVISGVGAVVYRILDEAYQSAFNDSLTGSYGVTFWIVFALVGALVWAWHWHGHLNAPGSIEGDQRQSPLWFFTVVVAGVLPGLIAMLVSVTMMISGVLIWFIGATDKDAADFFEPAAILTTVLFLGFVSWAYHRWELDRRGASERNESLRFHDYVVLATGLTGIVGAAAILVGQLFEAIAAEPRIAGSFDIANTMIVAVTVLVTSAMVWWWQWSLVEQHRAANAIEESDSIWRKLYLLIAFGVGGVVLGVSAIWVLFVLLRDLLDTQAGHDTLRDLINPVGWGVAVLGAVWYHIGVWRVDRAVLAMKVPKPAAPPLPSPATVAQGSVEPTSASSVGRAATAVATARTHTTVRAGNAADHGEVFTLQLAAAADRAVRAGTLDIAPLHNSFADMAQGLTASTISVAVDGSRIVGALIQPTGAPDHAIESQLVVAPDQDYDDVATLLLANAGAK